MQELRLLAATMDVRMRQLETEGVSGPEIVNRMAGHLPDLNRIWTSTSDEELQGLCLEFPGFFRYASIMEDAFEADRKNPASPYRDVQALPEPLRTQIDAVLKAAATLELNYQSVLDSKDPAALRKEADALNALHVGWRAVRMGFVGAAAAAGIPARSIEILTVALDATARRIGELQRRVAAAVGQSAGNG
jgi:hypothetical protein